MATVNEYTISTLRGGGSMNHDTEDFTGTYKEAVAHAQSKHLEHGRSVYVMHKGGIYWWHRCSGYVAEDRNTNSGVPKIQALKKDYIPSAFFPAGAVSETLNEEVMRKQADTERLQGILERWGQGLQKTE